MHQLTSMGLILRHFRVWAWPRQVGYLYLTDAARLHELMLYLGISGDNSAGRVAITL